jgi:hypothetical protein
MKVASSRTLAAANGSAGTSAGCGQAASSQSTITWLSHSAPWGVRMKGILPSGEAASTASSFEPVGTRSSWKGRPFSSRTSLTLS